MLADGVEVTPDLLAPLEVITGSHLLQSTPPHQAGIILVNKEDGRRYRIHVEEISKNARL